MALEKLLSHFADYLRHVGVLAASLPFVLLALKGDTLFLSILLYKTLQHNIGQGGSVENTSSLGWGTADNGITTRGSGNPPQYVPILPDYLQLDDGYNMKDLLFFIAIGIISAEMFYHILCGYLQIWYYVLQRESPEKWKCQPNRFLSRSNELHEVVVGTFNLIIAGIMSGFLSCWVMNDNYSAFYFKINQFGYLYFFSSIPLIFLWTEAMAYYSHRLLHTPVLYRLIHKQHHRYHTPTPYSVLAMSPFELILYQTLTLFPVFVVPVHPFVFIGNLVYVFYYSVMDHSGVKMEALWPWQPNTIFHDDHHKYFHCNFGFNLYLFDYLHGTLRRKDRIYGENVFGGKGKPKND